MCIGLKKGGVDKETAQRILKVWEQTGAKSPDELRKLLVNRSLKAAGLVGVQTLLDAGRIKYQIQPLSRLVI